MAYTNQNVLSTPIKAISFNNFFLPETFRLTNIRVARRLTSSVIQRREGILQQTSYNAPKELQIQGQVFAGQSIDSTSYTTSDEIIDIILQRFQTSDDRRLHIRDGRYYNARLNNSRIIYTPNTNRNVAELQLSFIASDPYQYNDTTTTINKTSGLTETLTNNGGTDTPLTITITMTKSVQYIEIDFFPGQDSATGTPDSRMILDSPGHPGDTSEYYSSGEQILIDSPNLELNYTSGSTTTPALDHIRNLTNDPIQNLPINIETGNTTIRIRDNSGAIPGTIIYQFTDRWV